MIMIDEYEFLLITSNTNLLLDLMIIESII